MPQVEHLVDTASEEIGGLADRKTPRTPPRYGRNLGETIAQTSQTIVSDQCVMECSGAKKSTELQQCRRIQHRLARQVDADEASHRLAVVVRVPQAFVGQTEPLLQAALPQHPRPSIG
jgi:hypothetical protein